MYTSYKQSRCLARRQGHYARRVRRSVLCVLDKSSKVHLLPILLQRLAAAAQQRPRLLVPGCWACSYCALQRADPCRHCAGIPRLLLTWLRRLLLCQGRAAEQGNRTPTRRATAASRTQSWVSCRASDPSVLSCWSMFSFSYSADALREEAMDTDEEGGTAAARTHGQHPNCLQSRSAAIDALQQEAMYTNEEGHSFSDAPSDLCCAA